jgi:hypothetical protein
LSWRCGVPGVCFDIVEPHRTSCLHRRIREPGPHPRSGEADVLHPSAKRSSGLDFAKQTAFASTMSKQRRCGRMDANDKVLRTASTLSSAGTSSSAQRCGGHRNADVFFVKKRRRTSASPLRGWGPGTRQSRSGVLAGSFDYVDADVRFSTTWMEDVRFSTTWMEDVRFSTTWMVSSAATRTSFATALQMQRWIDGCR